MKKEIIFDLSLLGIVVDFCEILIQNVYKEIGVFVRGVKCEDCLLDMLRD